MTEAAVAEQFGRNGWIIMRNGPDTDFGVDLAAFRRSDARFVLPHALSIQVKGVQHARLRGDAAIATVRASTLASWLWSNTPTICVIQEVTTGRTWWSTPVAALPTRRLGHAKSRTLRLVQTLDGPRDWASLAAAVADQWSHHQGVGALMDVALVLQVLTGVALDTELWTSAGGNSDAVHHAAAVHAYRTVSSLNALTGRTGSESFIALASPTEEQVGISWSHSLAQRNHLTLGVISGIELLPRSEYLLDVFGRCGSEFAAAIPRLQQLARMPELGVHADVSGLLSDVTPLQLAIIDPASATELTAEDFAQTPDRPTTSFPAQPDYDNRVLRPMGRPLLDSLAALRSSRLSPESRAP